jgi:acyl-CoA dehydrogenase
MSIDFTPTADALAWQARIRRFIDDEVIPREEYAFTHGTTDPLRAEFQGAARRAGVWAPLAPREFGGGGFRLDDGALLLEEAGRSLLGPLALNCAAPDEGNVHLLDKIADEAQRARYLHPLADGTIRSCFAMTEPPPGAGSDPGALRTTAKRVHGGWVINGEKHLITGAEGAAFAIVMARNSDGAGATMFLLDTTNPGWAVVGHTRTIDTVAVGGHCAVTLTEAFVADDAVLGEPGRGFQYAQVRLAPARLTHCMRWLGAARRAHEIALDWAITRSIHGRRLADHGMAQQLLADNEIELSASRAMVLHAAWLHASGADDIESSSRCKVFLSEATGRIIDRSVQLCGGMGTSEELVVGRIYADNRAFRIYDGPSEIHRAAIARKASKRALALVRSDA